jgi:hypothetical protein
MSSKLLHLFQRGEHLKRVRPPKALEWLHSNCDLNVKKYRIWNKMKYIATLLVFKGQELAERQNSLNLMSSVYVFGIEKLLVLKVKWEFKVNDVKY